MGSLELLSYFWSLNTVVFVKIENFDFDVLRYHPTVGFIFLAPCYNQPGKTGGYNYNYTGVEFNTVHTSQIVSP